MRDLILNKLPYVSPRNREHNTILALKKFNINKIYQLIYIGRIKFPQLSQ